MKKKNIVFRILNTFMLLIGALASLLLAYFLFISSSNSHVCVGESNNIIKVIEMVMGASAFVYLSIKACRN